MGVYRMFLQGPYRKIEPASAAIVMAIGIFLLGTIEAFPFLNVYVGKTLAFILLMIWVVVYGLLSYQFFHKDFIRPFIKHPVNSFAMGTWIAGVSVLCNVFLKYFPSIIKLTQFMALLNSLLWILFITTCVYNFKKLLFEAHDFPVHGVILLSTVGTQSIIVLLNNVFFELPNIFSETMIVIGLAFYIIGIILITIWIATKNDWTITADWSNTNCIIHGALSITGFAMVTTHAFTPLMVNLLWVVTFVLLVIVEGLEIIRATKRIRKYGWNQGVFSYHVSQWSRNFTFGMFFVFTLLMLRNSDYALSEPLTLFQTVMNSFWAWIVLFALIIEAGVFVKYLMNTTALFNKNVRE